MIWVVKYMQEYDETIEWCNSYSIIIFKAF